MKLRGGERRLSLSERVDTGGGGKGKATGDGLGSRGWFPRRLGVDTFVLGQ